MSTRNFQIVKHSEILKKTKQKSKIKIKKIEKRKSKLKNENQNYLNNLKTKIKIEKRKSKLKNENQNYLNNLKTKIKNQNYLNNSIHATKKGKTFCLAFVCLFINIFYNCNCFFSGTAVVIHPVTHVSLIFSIMLFHGISCHALQFFLVVF